MGFKKTFALVLIGLFLISIVSFQPATAKAQTRTLVVPDQYPTIQDAINNASAGDTVYVKNGTYFVHPTTNFEDDHVNIVIDKPLLLIGENSQKTIIKPQFNYPLQVGILVSADNVTISGFTIDGALNKGIIIDEVSRCRIIGNIIENSDDCIEDNGIMNDLIFGNTITSADAGVVLNSVYSDVSNNTVTRVSTGIAMSSSCVAATIKQNNIAGNGIDGLELDGNSVLVFENNITGNSQFGIKFYGANNCLVYNNNIKDNGIGVYIGKYSSNDVFASARVGNHVYYNNIVGNSQAAKIQSTYNFGSDGMYVANYSDIVYWDNGRVGNYWSDYQKKYPNATELNGLGIANTPYIIDQNNTDYHPLFHPIDINAIAPAPTPPFTIGVLVTSLTIPFVAFTVLVIFIIFILFRRHRKNR